MIDTKKSREILRKRTAGEWLHIAGELFQRTGPSTCCDFVGGEYEFCDDDAEAIVHAINNAESWLDEIDRLRAEVEELEDRVTELHLIMGGHAV